MILADKDYQQISQAGKCCSFLSGGSGIKYFGTKDMKELAQNKGIKDFQNKMLDNDLKSIVISKGNINLFKTMLCLEIKFNAESVSNDNSMDNQQFNYGYQTSDNLDDKLAICNINQKLVGLLKQRMMNSVITNIYHKRNEYDISVITNTQSEYDMFQ